MVEFKHLFIRRERFISSTPTASINFELTRYEFTKRLKLFMIKMVF